MIGSPAPEAPPLRLSRAAPRQAAHHSDEAITRQLRAPGAGVVRAVRQFQAEGTRDDARDRQSARHDHAVQPEASSPAS
jgi:hypothetical protein